MWLGGVQALFVAKIIATAAYYIILCFLLCPTCNMPLHHMFLVLEEYYLFTEAFLKVKSSHSASCLVGLFVNMLFSSFHRKLVPVQDLVEKHGAAVLSLRDEKGHTAAHWACLGGHTSILR